MRGPLERKLERARFWGRLFRRRHVTVELGPYLRGRIEPFAKQMRDVGVEVADQVFRNLQQLEEETWDGSDDDLFAPLTAYVSVAIRYYGCAAFPIKIWTAVIEPEVGRIEGLIGRSIHKGSPLFNVGLCYLIAGNVMHSAQYIDAAAEEDERRRPGSGKDVIVGSSGVAENVKRKLLDSWVLEDFGDDYRAATGAKLDKGEFKDLVSFLADNIPDAVLMLFSLRRVMLLIKGPTSYAVRMYHVRALADLALALESNLSRWQSGSFKGLHGRAEEMLKGNSDASDAFDAMHKARQPGQWTDPDVFNSMLATGLSAFDSATAAAERAGTAVYVTYGCRNSLMHALDETLDVFTDLEKANRVLAFALIAFKVAKLSSEGKLGDL